VDAIVTSPPYATALPYIDTDRLSLLVLFGLDTRQRSAIEDQLIGSREISHQEKHRLERALIADADFLKSMPPDIIVAMTALKTQIALDTTAGFRKTNMPALLTRYLMDMRDTIRHMYRVLKSGSHAWIVIGDNRMTIAEASIPIPTSRYIQKIAESVGFQCESFLDISVTRENLKHSHHSITENVVLRCTK